MDWNSVYIGFVAGAVIVTIGATIIIIFFVH